MFKFTLHHCWVRLRELGRAPAGAKKSKSSAYRSSFQRSIGAIAFLFAYFVLASQMLGSEGGSADNSGIFVLLIFAVIFAALGAFLAPRMAAFWHSQSLSGRRQKAGKSGSRGLRSSKSSSHRGSSGSQSRSDRQRASRSGRHDE
jgi:hypothetical protein